MMEDVVICRYGWNANISVEFIHILEFITFHTTSWGFIFPLYDESL